MAQIQSHVRMDPILSLVVKLAALHVPTVQIPNLVLMVLIRLLVPRIVQLLVVKRALRLVRMVQILKLVVKIVL